MRFFQFFQQKLNTAHSRITLNRVTTAFFIFSFVHCFAQGIIQSFLFSIDSEYSSVLSSITKISTIPAKNMTYIEGGPGNYTLHMCNNIPHGQKPDPCIDVFQSAIDARNVLSSDDQTILLDVMTNNLEISPVGGNVTGVRLFSGSTAIVLDQQCTQILLYPQQIMHEAKREDLTFVLLQFWLFAISVIAIMFDSVPHTLAVLMTRALITAWSAFAIWRTGEIKTRLEQMIFQQGTPCSFNVFPAYFTLRISYEIPDLILNFTALLIACYLSFTLLRDYNAQSFKCVGAPKHINRINKLFMAVSACLQLECFVLVAAGGLWIDVLINTAMEGISTHTAAYKALFIITTILLIPRISMGWFAIQREMKLIMVAFLGTGFLLLFGWSLMFYSIVYRWTFLQWPFLGCFTVASLVLLIASIVLGVICRLNFGKGLAQYLHAEAALASSNFAPEVFQHDEEKGALDYTDVKVPEAAYEEMDEAFYLHKGNSIIPPPPVYVSQTSPYQVPYNVPF